VKYFNKGLLDRVMVDKTGLEGYYDINLFVPPEISAGDPPDSSDTKASATPGQETSQRPRETPLPSVARRIS
jgi:uncharacterized protein (TIGR03435 family)